MKKNLRKFNHLKKFDYLFLVAFCLLAIMVLLPALFDGREQEFASQELIDKSQLDKYQEVTALPSNELFVKKSTKDLNSIQQETKLLSRKFQNKTSSARIFFCH